MTKIWLKAALIRAVRTVAQTAAALIGVGAVMSDIDWVRVGSAALLAGILSLLTSVAGLPEVEPETKIAALEEKLRDSDKCYVHILHNENELREMAYPPSEDEEDYDNA